MLTFALVTLVFFGQSSYQVGEEDTFLYDVFPPGFQWGFASSSYQVGTHLFNLGGGGGVGYSEIRQDQHLFNQIWGFIF